MQSVEDGETSTCQEERDGVDLECGYCDGIGRVCNECGEPANSEENDDMCDECFDDIQSDQKEKESMLDG